MARSIYCSVCKLEKEPGRDNESCCKKCKSDRNKANRLKARLARGQLPLGEGRSPYCYTCKALKENPKKGYCNACNRARDNEWRLETGRTKKHITGLCPCGAERAPHNPSYCQKCALEKNQAWRRANKYAQRPKTEEQKLKHQVRTLTRTYIRSGKLIKQPCEVCGNHEQIEAHHDDYTKPMDIRWLCRKHHREHHEAEKLLT